MSEIKVNKISPATGTAFTLGDSGDTFTVPSGATIVNSGTATGFGGGKVLQTPVSVEITSVFTSTSTSYVDVTGLTATITPTASSSKILCIVDTNLGNSVSTYHTYGRILRASTEIGSGVDASSRIGVCLFAAPHYTGHQDSMTKVILDSPATDSAVIYKVQVKTQANTVSVNASGNDSDASHMARLASRITLIEMGT